ncbi:MAG: hypothetical protein ACRBFS_20175 [Aureispira sp.]
MACKSLYTSTEESNVDLENVSYNNAVKNIIANNCIACHSSKRPSAGLNLERYENLVDAVKNKGLLKRINNASNPMPTSGLMSKNERLIIQKWVNNNFALTSSDTTTNRGSYSTKNLFLAPNIKAINIDKNGFEFLEKIQGHWVGEMFLLGQKIPWFAFDFRAINTSQVHGLFEGGSIGNLFNTFFVAEYKGIRTIMLRNGGVLGGVYRTSYFVLTKAGNNEYLFEDAYGGEKIMWVKVTFQKNKMKMLTYTSRLGIKNASKHMEFEGEIIHTDLSQRAAQQFNFPTKQIVKSFPLGMPLPNWGEEYPTITSASYITADATTDYITLGKRAGDPIQITDLRNIATLELLFSRTDLSKGKKINIYLSRAPLTDKNGLFKTEYGHISKETMNEVILFPEIDKEDNRATLTYLHTGNCYITFVIDENKDLIPNKGDFYSESIALQLTAETPTKLKINTILKTIK